MQRPSFVPEKVTKCIGTGCPIKNSCERFTAKTGYPEQTWLGGLPFDFDSRTCSEYAWNGLGPADTMDRHTPK